MGRFKSREPYWFGIDNIKAYVHKPIDKKSVLDGLSSNSNLWQYDKETAVYFLPQMASGKYDKYFEIIDIPTNTKLAFVLIGKRDNTGCTERRDVYEITGQGLMLRRIQFYLKLLSVAQFSITGFKRVDVTLDVLINTHYVLSKIVVPALEERSRATFKPHVVNGEYQGVEIGRKDPKKNTWKFVRIYNKIEDTSVKGKEWLYGFKEKGITELTRFELELRRDKLKTFKPEWLTDTGQLYRIFKHEVFNINFQFFKFIHEGDAKNVVDTYLIEPFSDFSAFNLTAGAAKERAIEMQERFVKYGSEFKNESDKNKVKATFLTYFRKLVGNGEDYGKLIELLAVEYRYLTEKRDVPGG